MKVKLEEIAKKSGYSIATVSRVLTGKAKGRSHSVSEILLTARELGYKTPSSNYKNISLPLDIAIITQHDAEEFYSCLYESFDRISAGKNIHLSIHSAKYSKNLQNQIQLLSKYNDGIILMAPTLDKAGYEDIIRKISSFPLVSIAPVEGNIVPTITFDSYEGGRLAAELLVNSGYQNFGVITGPSEKLEANLRRNGFQDFLRKNNYKIIPDIGLTSSMSVTPSYDESHYFSWRNRKVGNMSFYFTDTYYLKKNELSKLSLDWDLNYRNIIGDKNQIYSINGTSATYKQDSDLSQEISLITGINYEKYILKNGKVGYSLVAMKTNQNTQSLTGNISFKTNF